MASTITQLINNNFGGIRRKDAYFSAEKITCSDCQNVELFFTRLNSGVGIRTVSGNESTTSTITKVNLTVYAYANNSMSQVATDGVISGRVLNYHRTSDNEFFSLTRNVKLDKFVNNTQYYAFSNKEITAFTTAERNSISRTNLKLPEGFDVIDIFESSQNGIVRTYVYVDNNSHGRLYDITDLSDVKLIVTNLQPSRKACGVSFYNATQDIFIFSNGNSLVYVKYTNGTSTPTVAIHTLTSDPLYDVEGTSSSNVVLGLGLVVLWNRLWVFSGRKLWYSAHGNCEDFHTSTGDWNTKAGLIPMVKNITAIYAYLGSLAVFFKESSLLLEQDGTTAFKMSDESPGGCANYKSLVFHGTDLFFYDDTKKGVFAFKQIVIGDKTLGDNIAVDIQEELSQIREVDLYKIKALSVVTKDRNEVWFLIPIAEEGYSIVMIYDYVRGEWVKRKCQNINGFGVINGELYSVGADVYLEYTGKTFAGNFIESYYTCSTFNLGADNTMKITKFPPRVTVDGSQANNFFVQYVKNYNYAKTPKVKEIKSKNGSNVLVYDDSNWDEDYIYIPNNMNAITKIPSATFKALEITFYTKYEDQLFAIKSVELSKIKVKQV